MKSNALLFRMFPLLRWWPMVSATTVRADLVAGLIGAVVVLPQGVAFATLAGMPPEYGLYAAMVPAIVAGLWGSSLHLVSGPTNAISLVVFATLSTLVEPGTPQYVSEMLTLAFLVGLMQLGMGLARLGALVNFISHTVVVAFTAGAAILIIASQLKNFFGVALPRGASFLQTVAAFAREIPHIDPYVTLIGAVTLAAGIAARRWLPKIPYMLVAMAAGSLLGALLNFKLGEAVTHIKTVGALPAALPRLSHPDFSLDTLRHLVAAAAAVTILGLTEAVSISRSIATKSGQRIDGNQEFIGQGLSNLVGSFFSAFPTSGSFNRSGLNYEAGAKTPLASVFAALILLILLFVFAPLAAHLPLASMAAILFLVAWGLIDFHHLAEIARASRSEAAVLVVTFVSTLVMHLEFAIFVGITLSLLLYLKRTAQPRLRTIVPDDADPERRFRPMRPGEKECPQMKVIRIGGSLYFGAVSHVEEYFHHLREARPQQKCMLIDARGMNFVDVAGAELLAQEARKRRARGGRLWLSGVREGAGAMLHKPPYRDAIGDDAFFSGKATALPAVVCALDREVCRTCTVRAFHECACLPGPDGGK